MPVSTQHHPFRMILGFLRPYIPRLILSVILMMVFSVISGSTLGMISPLTRALFQPDSMVQEEVKVEDSFGGNETIAKARGAAEHVKTWAMSQLKRSSPYETLKRVCLIVLLLFLTRATVWYVQSYLFATIEQGLMKDIREALYRQLQNLSLAFFHTSRTGDLVSRITNDVVLVRGMVRSLAKDLIRYVFELMVYLIIIFWSSWQLALVSILIFPPIMYAVAAIGRRLRRQSVSVQERMADISSAVQERMAGIRIVKAFGMEDHEISRFSVLTRAYYKTMVRMIRLSQLAAPLSEFLGAVGAVAVLWFGGKLVLADQALSADRFLVFLAALLSTMSPVKALSKVSNRVQQGLAGGDRVAEILNAQPDVMDVPDAREITGMERGIEFDSVYFNYKNGREIALRGISFNLPKGKITAVVGPSGAGKSTAADLLARFYDPTGGRILLDGYDLKEIRLSSLRALMGIVTQETILFNDSIGGNISYGMPDANQEMIEEAAKAANIHDFIHGLPEGYDTPVGERGVQLSGGQRQRLAIARAILRNPPILIFDEATSSLDSESERLVQEAMERLMENRTSFVIAHRLSSVLRADNIIVMNHGEIVEEGTHADLLNRDGLYTRLYQWQFGDPPADNSSSSSQ